MIKRKSYSGPAHPAHWQVASTFQVSPRRTLKPGDWFRVEGIRGQQFQFVAYVINPGTAEWIDAFDAAGRCRAFSPERVRSGRQTATRPPSPRSQRTQSRPAAASGR